VAERPDLVSSSQADAATSTADVGGKAASLFRLLRLGFDVPPFFVVTAHAFRRSIRGVMDEALRAAIRAEMTSGAREHSAYAVRSSSVAEDSDNNSFAGVFDTFLDVEGFENVIDAIERCFASHRSERADAYRESRGVSGDDAMAVIVQRMVRADWAGVSFSADPLTQALSVVVVNAVQGLAEDLVSGSVAPHEIRVARETGAVIDERIAPGLAPMPEQLLQDVVAITVLAAERFGFPQDVEWAIENGRLFLLQSRPITTISGVFHARAIEPWAGTGDPDAPDRVWTRAYADEIWTPPVTPLFYDVHNLTAVTVGRLRNDGDRGALPPDIFKYYRAAPYMDADVLVRLYCGLPRFARRESLERLLPPECRQRLRSARWHGWAWLRRAWVCEVRHGERWGVTRNHRWLARQWPAFVERAQRLSDIDVTTLSDQELEQHVGDVWALAISVAPECEIAVLYYAHDIKLVLSGLLDRWCGDGDQLYSQVSTGLEGSETVRETSQIQAIAAAVRALGDDAVAKVRATGWPDFRERAGSLAAEHVALAFESFLRNHRHRGANYKELYYERWGDNPDLLWNHVKAFLAEPGRLASDANAASAERRRRAQRSILGGLSGPLAAVRRTLLRTLFRGNEIYAGIRDNHRFYYDYVWWLVRRAYLDMGRRCAVANKIESAPDVFFLNRAEIGQLQSGELDSALARRRIAVRRAEWHATKLRQPPRFLRNGYVGDADELARTSTAGRLQGLGASAGQVSGRARVVSDIGELGRVEPGDVLVTRQTDPGWTPVFMRIGGLVLETGGVLAHGASLCREYGLPCVTAVESATTLIAEGDEVRLDGGAGIVEIAAPQLRD
jgi:pyruvate,water dikinase